MGILTTLEPRLYAEDLFEGLRPEKEQGKDRKIKVKRNERLEELVREFEWTLKSIQLRTKSWEIQDIYKSMPKPKKSYDSKDIGEFLVLLERYQDASHFGYISGLFLSSLINYSFNNDFILHTHHLTSNPENIGYLNYKNIIIKGDPGGWAGYEMKNGKMIIEGNARINTGFNTVGGLIEIKGDVSLYLGCGMEGGLIRVYGNAGDDIGYGMKGGDIYLDGDYESISRSIRGGDIYHKGRQIIKNGKPVEGAKVKWAR
jgi:hypothetical protein